MKNIYKFLLAIAIICFVISLIFFFSGQSGVQSHGLSKMLATFVAEYWFRNLSQNYGEGYHVFLAIALETPIRKLAHLGIYTLLGFTTMTSIRIVKNKKISLRHVLFSIALVILVASCDEINQLYSGGRGSSISDVFIDTIGGCIGIYFIFFLSDLSRRIKSLFHS